MEEPSPRTIVSSGLWRTTRGFIFAVLGLLIIVINLFVIMKRNGQVTLLSVIFLALGVTLITGSCICYFNKGKTQSHSPECYASFQYPTTCQTVLNQSSVSEITQIPRPQHYASSDYVNNQNSFSGISRNTRPQHYASSDCVLTLNSVSGNTWNPRRQYYASSDYVMTQKSVSGIDDLPPKYEDCVALNFNNNLTTESRSQSCEKHWS